MFCIFVLNGHSPYFVVYPAFDVRELTSSLMSFVETLAGTISISPGLLDRFIICIVQPVFSVDTRQLFLAVLSAFLSSFLLPR